MRAVSIIMVMLLSGAGVALSACQSPEGVGRQASVTCPFVGRPNNNPFRSREWSERLCQHPQGNVAANANNPLAAKAESAAPPHPLR